MKECNIACVEDLHSCLETGLVDHLTFWRWLGRGQKLAVLAAGGQLRMAPCFKCLTSIVLASIYVLPIISYRKMGTEVSRASWETIHAMAHNLRMPNGE